MSFAFLYRPRPPRPRDARTILLSRPGCNPNLSPAARKGASELFSRAMTDANRIRCFRFRSLPMPRRPDRQAGRVQGIRKNSPWMPLYGRICVVCTPEKVTENPCADYRVGAAPSAPEKALPSFPMGRSAIFPPLARGGPARRNPAHSFFLAGGGASLELFTKRCGLKVRRCDILSRPNCLRGWKPHLRKSLAKWLQYFENRSNPRLHSCAASGSEKWLEVKENL